MTFQPVLPLSGYAGWLFLERTADQQRATFNESSSVTRITDTFRERIGGIQTAEDLVQDRELLAVALGAFGLGDDLDNTFFIKKVLEEGTTETDALANRLSDSRYADFSEAFGFGDSGIARTALSFFADDIIDRYEAEQFEQAVGEQDNDMRLALNFGPALNDVSDGNSTNNGRWFAMMGNEPLRSMFETALGFPSSFGAIDIDQQLEQFQARAEATFGTDQMSELASPENQEKMIRLYMLRSEISASSATSGASIALSLLQQI
ncbi:MAG TPA: flagellar protein [Octadecabacter sp.]|nr:flagellar protein [Octadecabacter sp.]